MNSEAPIERLQEQPSPSQEEIRRGVIAHESRHLLVDSLLDCFILAYYISPIHYQTHRKIARLLPDVVSPGEVMGVVPITRNQRESDAISRLAGLTADAERLKVDDPWNLADVSPDDFYVPLGFIQERMEANWPSGTRPSSEDVQGCFRFVFHSILKLFAQPKFRELLQLTVSHMAAHPYQIFPFVKKNLRRSFESSGIDMQRWKVLQEQMKNALHIDSLISAYLARRNQMVEAKFDTSRTDGS